MNNAVYRAARAAGCSARTAEIVATYVECQGAADTAARLRTTENVVFNHLSKARARTGARHNAGLIVELLGETETSQFAQST